MDPDIFHRRIRVSLTYSQCLFLQHELTLNKRWVVEHSIVISVVLSYIQVFKEAQRREKHTTRKS